LDIDYEKQDKVKILQIPIQLKQRQD